MPFSVSISPEKKLIHITLSGEVSTQDSIVLMNELPTHTDFNSEYAVLIDSTQMDRGPELKEMKTLASAAKKVYQYFKGPIALVVPPGYVHQSSIFALLVRPFGIHVEAYGDTETAKKFLNTGESWN